MMIAVEKGDSMLLREKVNILKSAQQSQQSYIGDSRVEDISDESSEFEDNPNNID
jgi:hypothetical protein